MISFFLNHNSAFRNACMHPRLEMRAAKSTGWRLRWPYQKRLLEGLSALNQHLRLAGLDWSLVSEGKARDVDDILEQFVRGLHAEGKKASLMLARSIDDSNHAPTIEEVSSEHLGGFEVLGRKFANELQGTHSPAAPCSHGMQCQGSRVRLQAGRRKDPMVRLLNASACGILRIAAAWRTFEHNWCRHRFTQLSHPRWAICSHQDHASKKCEADGSAAVCGTEAR